MLTSTTNDAFKQAINDAVNEYGHEYIYPKNLKKTIPGGDPVCLYFSEEHPDKPLCLIGVALHKLGLKAEELPWKEVNAYKVLRELGFTPEIAEAANAAQGRQDIGFTWGEALEEFNSYFGMSI